MADPKTRGTDNRLIESRGLGPTAGSAAMSLGRLYQGKWTEMAFQAAMFGFTVTGRAEAKGHNVGSRHYAGEAIDVRTAGRTNAEVAEFMAFMRSQGYLVTDERVRPPHQKVWGGPHVHVETFDWEGFKEAFSPLRDVR